MSFEAFRIWQEKLGKSYHIAVLLTNLSEKQIINVYGRELLKA
jgi:hypothetical protein